MLVTNTVTFTTSSSVAPALGQHRLRILQDLAGLGADVAAAYKLAVNSAGHLPGGEHHPAGRDGYSLGHDAGGSRDFAALQNRFSHSHPHPNPLPGGKGISINGSSPRGIGSKSYFHSASVGQTLVLPRAAPCSTGSARMGPMVSIALR